MRERYAGFGRRLGATLVDGLLLGAAGALLLYLAYGPAYFVWSADPDRERLIYGPAEVLINYVLPVVVTVACWHYLAGTPGKLLLGCRVVDARRGRPPGWGRALLRYLGYFVSALPLGLGFLWILWDRRKQGFHDKIAGTVVVLEDESRRSLAELEEELR